jgi:hypothetical protein
MQAQARPSYLQSAAIRCIALHQERSNRMLARAPRFLCGESGAAHTKTPS